MDKGTVITPLSAIDIIIFVFVDPLEFLPRDLHLVINYALSALGQPYNVRQLIRS